MDIKPGAPNLLGDTAVVVFEDFEERYRFSRLAPLYSREGWRWMAHAGGNTPPAWIVSAIAGRLPEEYPVERTVNESTLAHIGGRLMETLASTTLIPEVKQIDANMYGEITSYFMEKSELSK